MTHSNLDFDGHVLKILQILHHDGVWFAEVRFYFTKTIGDKLQAFALVSLYSPPNEHIIQSSHTTLVVCRYLGEGALRIVDVESILSVVAMIPFNFLIDNCSDQYFMIEKVGLDVVEADDLEDNE